MQRAVTLSKLHSHWPLFAVGGGLLCAVCSMLWKILSDITHQAYSICCTALDLSDGHQECPSCLGKAHMLDDVDHPCSAAADLPSEERSRGAGF